ncbi:MAG: T9SS type A sorting domain-containing protein [FCB group bacterium]|jgi:hypothetical protein
MKKIIIIFILFVLVQNLYSSNIISLPYITADVVFSKKNDKLYAVIDVMDTAYGNRLIEINPSTGAIERSLYVGSQPNMLRLTTDENYAWISFSAIPFVKRIDLNLFNIDKEIYLGQSRQTNSGNILNSQIISYNFTVFPNENNKLAITQQARGIFNWDGIVLYKDDKIQPKKINPPEFPSCIEPVLNSSYLIGHQQTSNSSVFTTMKILDDGLEIQDTFKNLIEINGTYRNNFKVHNDTLFVAEGMIIDAKNIYDLRYLGKCKNDFIDDMYGFAFSEIHDAFVYPNYKSDSLYLTFYDKHNFQAFKSLFLREYTFNQLMMILKLEIIDENKFAILLGKDYGNFYIDIIETERIETGITNKLFEEIEIYPNPTRDKIFISGNQELNKIEIFNLLGDLIATRESNLENQEINIRNFEPGIYYIKVVNPHNNSILCIKKIVVY